MLFQVYDRMSYGLVMESSQVIRRGDFVASPLYGHRDDVVDLARRGIRAAEFHQAERFQGACRRRCR